MDPAREQEAISTRVKLRRRLSDVVRGVKHPSAAELLADVENSLGLEARWDLFDVVTELASDQGLQGSQRNYFQSILESGDLVKALRGDAVTDREAISTIDLMLRQSARYRSSKDFQSLVDFMGRFRDYAPFNNMLVRVQNPSCSFYATAKDWWSRFERTPKEDARPLLILAPMHPVMLVYELDQTEGKELPKELLEFAHFTGEWDDRWLSRLIENAERYRIRVSFKPLSSTHGGFATITCGDEHWKRRIVVHEGLDPPSRFGVLCHELAHVLLGHLGSDWDYWWPSRTNLSRNAIEVEAESVAWIVTSRLGLEG